MRCGPKVKKGPEAAVDLQWGIAIIRICEFTQSLGASPLNRRLGRIRRRLSPMSENVLR
jgi:hypothetical protein